MTYSQITKDWNQRFLDEDTPWEDASPSTEMARLFEHFIKPGSKVLEIGCSKGTNGVYLAEQGYGYTGIDISEIAIGQAKELARSSGGESKFEVLDFMKSDIDSEYDVVFDKGCFHTFQEEKYRNEFAMRVAESLRGKGFWVCIAGNSDNPDDDGDIERYGFPRMSASEIVTAIENSFEIQYLARCIYGEKDGNANFLGWACVFQKR
jgi:cyclopropane fatty-acyl-phospholipid synthase-like methyltransferase